MRESVNFLEKEDVSEMTRQQPLPQRNNGAVWEESRRSGECREGREEKRGRRPVVGVAVGISNLIRRRGWLGLRRERGKPD